MNARMRTAHICVHGLQAAWNVAWTNSRQCENDGMCLSHEGASAGLSTGRFSTHEVVLFDVTRNNIATCLSGGEM